ncbi:hypothetical protein K439DRAFT_1663621 [Ramaria rubella]|nr:hypothetical protein K439DRAFT_1663621 [Ramaria rubella]
MVAFYSKPLTPEEEALIKPVREQADHSPNITIVIPGYGATEMTYPVAHLTNVKIITLNLKKYLETHNVILYCFCLLVSKSKQQDNSCILAVRASREYYTVSTCLRCGHQINWDLKRVETTLTRDFLDPQWAGQRHVHQILPFFPPASAQNMSIQKVTSTVTKLRRTSYARMTPFSKPKHLPSLSPVKRSQRVIGDVPAHTLDSTPSTASVNAYKMSTAPRITDKPFNFFFPTSSTTSVRSPNAVGGPSSQPFGALHFSASPSPPPTSLVYRHVMQHADDPMTGVTKFECTDLFEQCQRCGKCFSTEAYRKHILLYF